jgi:hypothetical protein
VADLLRNHARAAPQDAEAAPVPVVLPYDRVALFGPVDEDDEEDLLEPETESPILPVSNCLPASASPPAGTCDAVPAAPAPETEPDSPVLPVSNCLPTSAAPSGQAGTNLVSPQLLAELLAYTPPGATRANAAGTPGGASGDAKRGLP